MQKRLWITIVNNETAEQAVRDGRRAALTCAVLFGLLAIDGTWVHPGQGAAAAGVFAVIYLFAAWGINRGSADLMELAMIFLPFGASAVRNLPVLRNGYSLSWYVLPPVLIATIMGLLNGVRGVSYLHAPLGIPRRGGDDAQGEIGVGTGPHSPLRPRDARASDPA